MTDILKKIIPDFLINYYRNRKYGEYKKSFGSENADKTFYVIGFKDLAGGVFWIVNKALMHISYALDNGYIPVIDYKNNETQYTGEDELGRVNIWEKFFKQPCGYDLDDIKNSKNVVFSCKYASPDNQHFMGNFYDDRKKIEYFRSLYKNYIKYSERVREYLTHSELILKGKGRILGVLCRGTDYVTMKPGGHPIPPSTEKVIEKAKEVMRMQNCDYLFLATEDEEVFQLFFREFGEKLIVNQQKRISKKQLSQGKVLSSIKMDLARTGEERFISGLQYLEAIYLLSKCNCFIGVRCGGTKGALILSDGFEYEYTFDLGVY